MENIKWYEKIGFFDFLVILIKNLRETTRIYFDKNQCKPFVSSSISALGIKNITPAQFNGMGPGSDGKTIIYKLYPMLKDFQDFVATRQASHTDPFINSSVRCFIAQYLFYQTFSFVQMVLSCPQYRKGQVVVLNTHPFQFQYLLREFFTAKGITVHCNFCFLKTFRFYLRPIIYLVSVSIAALSPKIHHSKGLGKNPSIWVEYVHNSIVDYSSWFRHLPAHNYDVAYYLDRSDPYPISLMINSIENKGIKWIDVRSWRIFRSIPVSFGIGLAFKFFRAGHYPWWYRSFLFEYYYRYRIYHDLFLQYKVKVLIQHGETSWIQGPQAAALRDTGGVMVGYHWSNYQSEMGLGTHFFPQDIFFVWGQWMRSVIRQQNNLCKYILPIGPLGLMPHSANDISPEILSGQFVIGIFDSSVAYNIEQTPDALSLFYDRFFKLLETHISWSAIIKSKNYSTVDDFKQLPGGGTLFDRICKLQKSGRIMFVRHTVSPLAVACQTNLSICFGLNSAGILLGIQGYRAIHWDCAGWLDFPVYKNLQQKILYTDLFRFENAILDASQGDTTVGEFSILRDLGFLSCFNDDLGDNRMALFIHDLMEELSLTQDTGTALNNAVIRYIDRNALPLENSIG